eukprot:TRINITY_DN2183_c0_g1_i1.p1 TRINITY_DN2183_c0_g1~~TRINITY_DN2183_c0_g1_i1.p1  ORF type:complete len:299 (-),score=34.13 TRINITY_DN2183_c0_g1_i1:226-1122(-)
MCLWILSFSLLISLQKVSGQMADGFGKDINEKAAYVKGDLKFIRCQACQLLAKQAYRQVKDKRSQLPPGQTLKEIDIIEMMEKITDPDADEGEWITQIDIQEKGDKLVLVEYEDYSECKSECRTIAKACEQLLEDFDTDLAEALWKGDLNRAKITNYLCYDLTDACNKPIPKVPKSRKPGPQFVAMTKEERDLAKQLAQMKQSGMKGQLFDRNAAEQYLEQMKDLYDLDYSDDDLDDVGSKGQGKVESNPLGVLDNVMGHVNKGIDLGMKYGFDMYQKASKWVGKTYDSLTNPKKSEL